MKDQLQNHERDSLMREAFFRSTRAILQNEDRFRKPHGGVRVGLEMETSVLSQNATPVQEQGRDQIVQAFPAFTDVELGASQLEWRTDPFVLNSPGGLTQLFTQAQEHDGLLQTFVKQQGMQILRSGTNPFVPISDIQRTSRAKYQLVPDFHDQNRIRLDTQIGQQERGDVGSAAVVALLNSLQCNIEAADFTDAVDMLNRSLMIEPMIVALSGNGRMLAGADTGIADVRMTAWEVSHDVRSAAERVRGDALRVGMPNRFFTNLEDYFQRAGSHPFILFDPDHALQIGIGLFWQDTRIKVIGDSLVVEFRPVSIQPTVQEDIATMMFYVGRLLWSKQHKEELIPIEHVAHNRTQAMNQGLRATFVHGQVHALAIDELQKAEEGLIDAGVEGTLSRSLLEILRGRVENGLTPSDSVAQTFHQALNQGVDRKTALQIALQVQ